MADAPAHGGRSGAKRRRWIPLVFAALGAVIVVLLAKVGPALVFDPHWSLNGDFKEHLVADYYVIGRPGVKTRSTTLHVVRSNDGLGLSLDYVLEDVSEIGLRGSDILGKRDVGDYFLVRAGSGRVDFLANEAALKQAMGVNDGESLPAPLFKK